MMKNVLYCCVFLCCFCLCAQNSAIDSLHHLIKKSSSKSQIDHFIALAERYNNIQNRNLDSAQYYAKNAIKLSQDNSVYIKKIDAQYILGLVQVNMKKHDEALSQMEQVLLDSQELSYAIGERKGNLGIGYVFAAKTEFLKGVSYYERAYELVKENGEGQDIIIDMTVRLSMQYKNIQDYQKASKLLEKGAQYLDHPSISLNTKCLFYINAALINYELENFGDALEQFKKALEFAEENDHAIYQIVTLANIGNLYNSYNSNFKEALKYNLRALKLINENPSAETFRGTALSYLGNSYFRLEAYEKAIVHFEQAIEILRAEGPQSYGEALMSLGYAHKKINQRGQADTNFKDAAKQFWNVVEMYKSGSTTKGDVSSSYRRLSEIDSLQGNFKKSLENYKMHTAYKDSLSDETNIKITERLDFVEQTAKKDKEISELAYQNKEQGLRAEQQENKQLILLIILGLLGVFAGVVFYGFNEKKKSLKIIEEKNNENKLLMGEIHHRVKNNLQIILSLLNTQIDRHKENTELITALTESQNKIRSMAIIHKSLYQGNQFAKVIVNTYLQELIDNLQQSFGQKSDNLQFELDIDHKEIGMGLAVPLGLILNELITNCYKYAFPDIHDVNNTITIAFRQEETTSHASSQRFKLLISDNGTGLPENFDLKKPSSFGMQLIQGLVSQLNGKIEVVEQEGTAFDISLEEPLAA